MAMEDIGLVVQTDADVDQLGLGGEAGNEIIDPIDPGAERRLPAFSSKLPAPAISSGSAPGTRPCGTRVNATTARQSGKAARG